MKVHIEQGTPDKASHIASLIMEAMNTDCCQNFAGPHHTLVDFHQMMERLVKMEDSQYSYLNTLVASNSEGIITGILVAYDGARYFSNMASASGSNFTRASILFFFLWYFSQRLPSSSRKRFSSVMETVSA